MELRGVAVRYGRRRPLVLGQVSLTLPAGSLVEVTGRNGAGKSSLLRVLVRPAVVGWAPEHLPTAQPFTAGAYLLAQARVRGLDARAAAQAVARQARRLNLEPLLETRLPELSLGSAQKIGLAQALLVRPGLLVLDEPWSSLDAHARTAVPALVRDVLQDGGRVVVTDHQGQAAALSPDRRWHVADGTVVDHPGQVDDRVAVEVEVPAVDAPALLEELRRRGLSPRLR